MHTTRSISRYVVARDNNVVRVDFGREPDPPAPRFPGAGALRESLDDGDEVSQQPDAVGMAVS